MPLKVVSLYTGVGGLDFGFEAAGFKIAVALEMDSASCQTIRANRAWRVIERDIHAVSSNEILAVAGAKSGDVAVLTAGPPCQPFSKSGYWVRGDSLRLEDERSSTLGAFLRVLRDTRPQAFLLENVHGLAYKNKDEGLRLLLSGIEQVNRTQGTRYAPAVAVLNAADYGVPQVRERVFVVGARDGTRFRFPHVTHGSESDSGLEPFRTAWDAIGDLPRSPDEPHLEVGGRWTDLLPSIPEGENYLWHTDRGGGKPLFGWRTRYWSFLLKLAKSRPSWTIQASPGASIGPFHWSNRKLSTRELCRLQTFPEGLRFECGRTHVQRMLGNAVPSLLAEVLALEIRRQLLRQPRRERTPLLLPERRVPVPPAEPLRLVPRKYLVAVGSHPAHPGTGKGPRGRLRRGAQQGLLFGQDAVTHRS